VALETSNIVLPESLTLSNFQRERSRKVAGAGISLRRVSTWIRSLRRSKGTIFERLGDGPRIKTKSGHSFGDHHALLSISPGQTGPVHLSGLIGQWYLVPFRSDSDLRRREFQSLTPVSARNIFITLSVKVFGGTPDAHSGEKASNRWKIEPAERSTAFAGTMMRKALPLP